MGLFDFQKNKDIDLSNQTIEKLTDEHAVYIKGLVEKAGQVDNKRKVFGSGKHQYQLNPVITIEKVKEHEEKYNVRLPEEYTFFLTKVGNGGAGPYYGLYTLEQLEKNGEYINVCGNQAWINNSLTKEIWSDKMEQLDKTDDNTYELIINEVCGGFNVIGTQGCTFDNLLMNNGSEEGKIVYIDWNLEQDNEPYLTGMTFLEWYEKFFLEIIYGNGVNSYGYISLGTAEELISAFSNADAVEKESIMIGFYRFQEVDEKTIRFLMDIDDKNMDAIRVELLFRFAPDLGMKLFDTMISGTNQQGAVMCARRMPEEYRDRYYTKMLELLNIFDTPQEKAIDVKLNEKILYFLKDCRSLRAKDLINFASDENIEESERKTAIYVMGQAGDKMQCIKYFITYMQSDSYWIAHTALQAMARVKSHKLLKTYEWMWNKYKDDRTMRSNLEIAFRNNGIIKK